MRTRLRTLAVAAAAVSALSGLTACGGPTPPSCATHQDGLSMTEQSECLSEVGDWCQKNYPDDLACNNKVYGYVPGKPGDDN